MDVGCPKCQTEYDLDDARVPDDGVTVKCTSCKHVFRVKRKSLVVTLPVKLEDAQSAISPPTVGSPVELPPPPPAREWKVRQPKGNVFACRELTTLQKWIIEGKVARDDEISLTGDTWKRLGDIPELASFFQVVDEAAKARSWEAQRTTSPSPLPSVMPPPLPTALAATDPNAITATWREPQFTARVPQPPPSRAEATTEPAGSLAVTPRGPLETQKQAQFSTPGPSPKRAYEPTESALARAAHGGSTGRGRSVGLVIAGLLLCGGVGAYFGLYEPARLERERAALAAVAPLPVPVLPLAEDPAVELDAGLEPADNDDAAVGMPEVVLEFDAGEQVVDAGPEVVDAGLAAGAPEAVDANPAVEDAGPRKRLSWGGLLAQADRLRDRDQAATALEIFDRAHQMKPNRVEPLTGRGLTLLDLNDAAGAQAAFEDALKLNDRYGPAIMGLAESLRLQGKHAKAVEYYRRYLEVSPDGAEAAVARNNIERLKK
jgi:predicted Zn finger-like uncharacterized protein